MRPDRRPQFHQALERLKASLGAGGGEGKRDGFYGDEGRGVQRRAFVFGAGQEETALGCFLSTLSSWLSSMTIGVSRRLRLWRCSLRGGRGRAGA